tara:strand:- start:57 stop:578 length:522 start_codon:yes stop_codon:yes gene_type:complete
MAGTGQGALQPTKLIQTDDFMETIAPPGYKEIVWDVGVGSSLNGVNTGDLTGANGRVYIVPDGMTVEIMDFGFTVADELGTANITTIKLIKETDTTAVDLTAAASWLTGDGNNVTKSVGRGTFAWAAGADTQAERQIGPGVQLCVTATKGSAAAGCASFWIRLKYVSKDNGTI